MKKISIKNYKELQKIRENLKVINKKLKKLHESKDSLSILKTRILSDEMIDTENTLSVADIDSKIEFIENTIFDLDNCKEQCSDTLSQYSNKKLSAYACIGTATILLFGLDAYLNSRNKKK